MSPNNLHKNRLVRDSCNGQIVIFYDAEARNQTLGGQTQANSFHLYKLFFGKRKCSTNCQRFNSSSASIDELHV